MSFFRRCLENSRGQRGDLGESPLSDLLGNNTVESVANGLICVVDQHTGVVIKLDVRTVGSSDLLLGSNNHSPLDFSLSGLLGGGGAIGDGSCSLDNADNLVTNASVVLGRLSKDLDALDKEGAGVVDAVYQRFEVQHFVVRSVI